jgi:hypothetical protein
MIFDHAILDNRHTFEHIDLRMSVIYAHLSVCGPSKVTEPTSGKLPMIAQAVDELLDATHTSEDFRRTGFDQTDPTGIVASLFQVLDSFDENRQGDASSYVTNQS